MEKPLFRWRTGHKRVIGKEIGIAGFGLKKQRQVTGHGIYRRIHPYRRERAQESQALPRGAMEVDSKREPGTETPGMLTVVAAEAVQQRSKNQPDEILARELSE